MSQIFMTLWLQMSEIIPDNRSRNFNTKGIWQPPLKSWNSKIRLHSVLSWPKIRIEPKFHESIVLAFKTVESPHLQFFESPHLRGWIFTLNWGINQSSASIEGNWQNFCAQTQRFASKNQNPLTFSRKAPWSPQLHCGDRNPVLKAKATHISPFLRSSKAKQKKIPLFPVT